MKMKRILKSFRGSSGGKHHQQQAAQGADSGTEDLTGSGRRASLRMEAGEVPTTTTTATATMRAASPMEESVQYPANYGEDDDDDNFSLYTDTAGGNGESKVMRQNQKVYGEVESYFSSTNTHGDDGTLSAASGSGAAGAQQQQESSQQQNNNKTSNHHHRTRFSSPSSRGSKKPPKGGTAAKTKTITTVRIPPPPSSSSCSTPPTSNVTSAAAARTASSNNNNNNSATAAAAEQQQQQPDRSAETRNLVKRFIADIWNRGELDLIPAVCSPALRFNGNTGFDRVGHDGLARMVHQIRAVLAEYHCEIHSMVVEDNKCFCRLRFTGRHVGALNGFPPTHRAVAWMGAAEYTCQNGKILKVWELGDMKSLEKQLRGSDKEEEEKKSNGNRVD